MSREGDPLKHQDDVKVFEELNGGAAKGFYLVVNLSEGASGICSWEVLLITR